MIKGFDDFQKLSKGNMDLMVKSFGELSKGLQVMTTEAIDYSRRSVENGTLSAEKVMAAGTIDRACEAQIECLRIAYEDYVTQVNRAFEVCLGALRGAVQPIVPSSGKAASGNQK